MKNYDYSTRFCYVDAYYQKPSGKSTLWRRIKISEIDKLVKKAANFNVFTTVQQFCLPEKKAGELQWAPLYFDFDASEKNPFSCVQEDVQKLLDFFYTGLNLTKNEVRTYYSGKKGMHIFVNAISLGIEPHSELTYIFKNIALYLVNFLKLKTLDTASIYSIRRQMRVPDSIHAISRLFKIELDPGEISKPEQEIRTLAKNPRGSLYDESEFEGLIANETAARFYQEFLKLYEEQKTIEKLKPQKVIRKSEEFPPCVKDLLENHIRKSGTRNLATICLSCYFKDQGYDEKKTQETLAEWASKTPLEFTSTRDERKIKASTISCVKTTYENKDYHFICSVIRSLGNINCDFDRCKIASEADQEPEKTVEIHLSQASKACYIGTKLKTKVMVVGKDTSPFVFPEKIELTCTPDLERENSPCRNCELFKRGNGRYELNVSSKEPTLLELIQCSTSQQIATIKRIAKVPRCPKIKLNVLEEENLEEVELIPSVDRFSSELGSSEEYVTRKAFYIGQGLELNQEFEITCYTHPDPRTQHAVHIFPEYRSADTSLNAFKMTNKIQKELEIFQLQKDQSVRGKFDEIYTDLERNILHIWSRRDLFVAYDLVYHSIISFPFMGKILSRGWAEGLIIGDPGQAKSDSFIKISTHYGWGIRISGEGARRTGLCWTWQQTANRWFVRFGSIPQNDRKLCALDEASGIESEELAKMTDMRSAGIADATGGPVPAKARARTRLIWLTNARNGQPLATFPFGIEAVAQFFKKGEDIRRLDFCVAVRSGDVSIDLVHQSAAKMPEVEHRFTSYLCHQLILWTWTRRANQIEILPEAEQAILDISKRFSQKYSSLIPIVEPADQRNRIARLAVAIACRVFSTEDGEKVIVKPEHAEFVEWFLVQQYDGSALDYLGFSGKNRRDVQASDDFGMMKSSFRRLKDSDTLASVLLSNPLFRKSNIQDMVGYEKDEIQSAMRVLSMFHLIKTTARGYRITAAGIDFLKRFKGEDEYPKDELLEN